MIDAAQEREFCDNQYRRLLELPDLSLRLDRSVLESNLNQPGHPFFERRLLYRAAMAALEAEPLTGKRVLDYGSGPADFGVWMATEAAEVTLLDTSHLALELGLRRAQASGVARRVKGVTAHAAQLDMFADHAFDLVFACASMHDALKSAGALEELARVMRPGARLVLCESRRGGLLPHHARLRDAECMTIANEELRLLEQYFHGFEIRHLNLPAMAERFFRGHFHGPAPHSLLALLERAGRLLFSVRPMPGEMVIRASRL